MLKIENDLPKSIQNRTEFEIETVKV